MSDFLHIALSTMLYEDFLPVAYKLFKRMVNQGVSIAMILKQVKKGMDRHPSSFEFSKTSTDIINDIKTF